MSGERKHTRFSPSRSEQFFLCPGAPNLLARTPARPSTTYSEEGNIAHAVLEAGLRAKAQNATQALEESEYGFGILEAGYGHIVKNITEFKSSINDALNYVWGLMDALPDDAQLYIEVRVDPPINSAPGEAAGYCDIAIHSATARILYVIDYKHGAGVTKAVHGNTQVKQYAAGFLYDPASPVDKQTVDTVVLGIVQPRAFHPDGDIREYKTTPFELADYLMELDEQIELCMQPDAPLAPGADQCRFCDARSTCPAIERQALAVAGNNFASIRDVKAPNMPSPESLDVSRLGYIFQHAPMLRGWLNDIEKHIYALQMNGVNVPGTKLVEADAKRTWYGTDEERAKNLSNLTGLPESEFYRTSFKTITDVQELVVGSFKARVGRGRKKQAAEEAKKMFAYSTIKQSSGTLTLATDDDPRPPFNRALKAFDGVAGVLLPPTTT